MSSKAALGLCLFLVGKAKVDTRSSAHPFAAAQAEFLVDGKLGVWEEGPIWVIYNVKNPNRSMPQRGS
jgi:hypothetical protein